MLKGLTTMVLILVILGAVEGFQLAHSEILNPTATQGDLALKEAQAQKAAAEAETQRAQAAEAVREQAAKADQALKDQAAQADMTRSLVREWVAPGISVALVLLALAGLAVVTCKVAGDLETKRHQMRMEELGVAAGQQAMGTAGTSAGQNKPPANAAIVPDDGGWAWAVNAANRGNGHTPPLEVTNASK